MTLHESSTNDDRGDAPRPGCPIWCTEHDDEYNQHCSAYAYLGTVTAVGIGVALRQGAGLPAPTLYVGNMGLDTSRGDQPRQMASLMRRLGREDVAVAIEELAALAAGQDGPR
jgi:hypothetical protein